MIDIYQFIRYNNETSVENLLHKAASGAILCFDLEDSINNWIDPDKGDSQKNQHRIWLNQIIQNLNAEVSNIRIGIRINAFDSGQQHLDLDSIPTGSHIHTILIPKVESSLDIERVAKGQASRGILCDEIIPIIESRNGLAGLAEILSTKVKVSKVGFGHCDYNLTIGAFPFYHQDSFEYWKWVSRIIAVLKPLGISFINSAHLELSNSDFFQSMLSHLQNLCPEGFGQFTLSHDQSRMCRSFSVGIALNHEIAKSRLDLSVDKAMLESFIKRFENENTGRGFTVTAQGGLLISPQEYCAAQRLLNEMKVKDINFIIVGGCFAVQGDILFEDLFHQTLKKNVEQNLDANLQIHIIRYEKFSNCMNKISVLAATKQMDYLAFHIRPEPFLRLVKLYYKYLDDKHELHRSLNRPFSGILNPEKHDLLTQSRHYHYNVEENRSFFRKAFINLNYLLGFLIGNGNHALKLYQTLALDVIAFCDEHNIKVIILGPAIRSNTFVESVLSRRLEKYMSKALKDQKCHYVFGLEAHHAGDKTYFKPNGIHATEQYHDLIAERLFEVLIKDN